ncbi:MAG: cyclase family protein [Steroidobacteraceae bacterium]
MRFLPGSALELEVDFNAATSLALPLDFDAPQPQHFGAPAATSMPFRIGNFEGAVARGASCNCQRLTLIPHCNGTHTESASHLTVQQRPLHEIVPAGPMDAVLLTVLPEASTATSEDSLPGPRAGDRLITRTALLDAWSRSGAVGPQALLLRTGTAWTDQAPPYLSQQLMQELVARGIEHLVTDLPSVDRLEDDGLLTAHRIFFGLPERSTNLADARRAHCTITELARFPRHLADGACALQLQIPAFSGDAVPSRPLHLPRMRA